MSRELFPFYFLFAPVVVVASAIYDVDHQAGAVLYGLAVAWLVGLWVYDRRTRKGGRQ